MVRFPLENGGAWLVSTCDVKWDYIQGDVTGGLWAQGGEEDGPAIISSAFCSESWRGISLVRCRSVEIASCGCCEGGGVAQLLLGQDPASLTGQGCGGANLEEAVEEGEGQSREM